MSVRKKEAPGAQFKAKVGLEALKGTKTINEIGQEYGVHPIRVSQWTTAAPISAPNQYGPCPITAIYVSGNR